MQKELIREPSNRQKSPPNRRSFARSELLLANASVACAQSRLLRELLRDQDRGVVCVPTEWRVDWNQGRLRESVFLQDRCGPSWADEAKVSNCGLAR